jgi:O-methyltransferase
MLKNSFWLTHRQYGSRAQVFYGDACHLPDELGSFDVAIMASVLPHAQTPLQIVSECVTRANSVVITTGLFRDLEGRGPICRLHPSEENQNWGDWWHFSTSFFTQYLSVMGYRKHQITFHTQEYHDNSGIHHPELFTIVASS